MSVSEKVKVSQFWSHLFSITAIIIYFLLVHVRMTQSLSFHARKFWRSDTGASSHGVLQHHSARSTFSLKKFSNSEYRKWVHVKQWSRRRSWVLRVTMDVLCLITEVWGCLTTHWLSLAAVVHEASGSRKLSLMISQDFYFRNCNDSQVAFTNHLWIPFFSTAGKRAIAFAILTNHRRQFKLILMDSEVLSVYSALFMQKSLCGQVSRPARTYKDSLPTTFPSYC